MNAQEPPYTVRDVTTEDEREQGLMVFRVTVRPALEYVLLGSPEEWARRIEESRAGLPS